MNIIESNVKEWRLENGKYETPEGLSIDSNNLMEICKYNNVPGTLVGVDKKYNTSVTKEVLTVAAPKVRFMVEDDKFSVLDPKSAFVSDDLFDTYVNMISETGEFKTHEHKNGFEKSVTFEFKEDDKDVFCNDAFKKFAKIVRLPQGGLQLQTDILRLVCTNGSTLNDSQFKLFMRNGVIDNAIASTFMSTLDKLSLNNYFQSLFFKNGAPIMASVSDYLGMHDTLARITDNEDLSDILFPVTPIKEFYTNQDIDIETISRNNLTRLPAGVNYYQCFNILTNGAKHAEKNLKNEIEVAKWCKPSTLNQLKQSNFVFTGMPEFSAMAIKERMGDIN